MMMMVIIMIFGIDMNSETILPSPHRLQPSHLPGERRERAETFVAPVDVDVDMLSTFFSYL